MEDTKEYYNALYQGVEENANLLNGIANVIKSDISESSAMLNRKEIYHTQQTVKVNQKLEDIMKLLQDKNNGGK